MTWLLRNTNTCSLTDVCAMYITPIPAAGLPEVRHRTKLGVDRPPAEPAIVEVLHRGLRRRLVLELDVDVPHQVIAQVVAHVHLLDLAVGVLALAENLLEEVVVVLLHLLVSDAGGEVAAVGRLGGVLGIDVEVLDHQGLGEGRLVVDAAAAVAVPAGADLEVEAAVDLILLRAEDGGEVLGHGGEPSGPGGGRGSRLY